MIHSFCGLRVQALLSWCLWLYVLTRLKSRCGWGLQAHPKALLDKDESLAHAAISRIQFSVALWTEALSFLPTDKQKATLSFLLVV